MTDQRWPAISVVVPCLNGERDLAPCLESVRACGYPDVELIVIDNGSRDRSIEIARRYADIVEQIPGVTVGALRNRGVARSRGSVLAFLDADCVARPDWLHVGVRSLQEEPCVCGYLYDLPDDATWVERDWFCQRDPGRREVPGLGGGNLFVEKAVFERIGGFDERLRTGEDAEFCRRARRFVKVISDDRTRVVHLGNPKTLRQFLRREIWHGLGAFGSLNLEKFDLPLIGTLVFIACTLGQLGGVALAVTARSMALLATSTASLFALIATTLFYRRRFLQSAGHAVRLGVLYYVYYLGRALSFFFIATGRPYYHNLKT
jgi:glycosyltransferase involved in cell wall biosynthesis